MVGLDGFENHYPKSLSGGMKMRASLARTLTMRPPIFLFDEPFGAVDEITREHLNEADAGAVRAGAASPGCSSPTRSARPCS